MFHKSPLLFGPTSLDPHLAAWPPDTFCGAMKVPSHYNPESSASSSKDQIAGRKKRLSARTRAALMESSAKLSQQAEHIQRQCGLLDVADEMIQVSDLSSLLGNRTDKSTLL